MYLTWGNHFYFSRSGGSGTEDTGSGGTEDSGADTSITGLQIGDPTSLLGIGLVIILIIGGVAYYYFRKKRSVVPIVGNRIA